MTVRPPAPDDSFEARISDDCPAPTRLLLHAAWARDISELRPLLREPGWASVRDPKTGETALHAVIRGCGAAAAAPTSAQDQDQQEREEDGSEAVKVREAVEALRELFVAGAIWNDVDDGGETAGCLAWRLGRRELYGMCVEAGVRAEMLFGLLGGYEELSSGGGEAGDDDLEVQLGEGWGGGDEGEITGVEEEGGQELRGVERGPDPEPEHEHDGIQEDPAAAAAAVAVEAAREPPVDSERYLASDLTFSTDRLLDADGNGVMMAWERPIMERTAAALLPGPAAGKRILNIGFGMGVIDSLFAASGPARHHIVEAHPAVLARLAAAPAAADPAGFGPTWEAGGPSPGAFRVWPGRWQDVVPQLLGAGEVYDAVYFDTFGEDYRQLRRFFTDLLPGLLDPAGRFSYFNGCGADRRICYDVYARVAEAHLAEAGMDVEWVDVPVGGGGGEAEAEDEDQWKGVRRRYWTLEAYRLPICSWMG